MHAAQDRTSEGELTQEQLQSERDTLKGQNVLTVLGALHATLKMLWAFKVETSGAPRSLCGPPLHAARAGPDQVHPQVDAEAELRGRAANRAQAAADRGKALEEQIRLQLQEVELAKVGCRSAA